MSDKTAIEWTDATWNPVTGCTEVSPGCDNCYAETFAKRFRGTPGHYFENGFDVQLRPGKLDVPLRWKKPRRIFVNSMSDLFHDDVPTEFIARVFAVMAQTPQHTYQLLTKRHGRMSSLIGDEFDGGQNLMEATTEESVATALYDSIWPLPNLWLGVSAEDQKWADIRIPALLETAAAVRFVSAEPLLGPIQLRKEWVGADVFVPDERGIDWLILGGESGSGARPMDPEWARSLVDQSQGAALPVFVKQLGSEWASDQTIGGKTVAALGDRKGGDPQYWPAGLEIREFPLAVTA